MSGYEGLQDVVAGLKYRGWEFRLQAGSTFSSDPALTLAISGYGVSTTGRNTTANTRPYLAGLVMLFITYTAPDSSDPEGRPRRFTHGFAAPDPVLIARSAAMTWDRWVFNRIADIELHERMEVFEVNGFRPFYPEHGSGAALYSVIRRPEPGPVKTREA